MTPVLGAAVQQWLCRMLTSLHHYMVAANFAWMFVEGLFLHNRLAISVFSSEAPFILFYLVGWGQCPFNNDDDDNNNNDDDDDDNIIIIIIIAFKGTNRDFFTISLQRRELSQTHFEVARAQSCANHVQHIERLSRATCRVACHVVRRESSALILTELK